MTIPNLRTKAFLGKVLVKMEKFILKRRLEKLVISGNTVEYFRYRRPIPVEKFSGTPDPFKQYYRNFDETGKRQDNIFAARANLRRTIWANVTPYSKFVTLTYKDAVLDVDTVFYDLKQFFKRLNRAGYKYPYLYVLERQKERGKKEGNAGSWHVHCIFFFAYIFMYLHCCLELGYAFCQKLVDIMYCICVNKYLPISTRCVELFAVTLEIAHGTCQILQKCQNAPGSHGA